MGDNNNNNTPTTAPATATLVDHDINNSNNNGDIWNLMNHNDDNNGNGNNLLFTDFHSELHDYLQQNYNNNDNNNDNDNFEKLDLGRLLGMDELIQELAVVDENDALVRFLAQPEVLRELIYYLTNSSSHHLITDSNTDTDMYYYTITDENVNANANANVVMMNDFQSIKAPYMAAQVLCSNVSKILVTLVNDVELLNLLLTEIEKNLRINVTNADRLAGYLENILDILFVNYNTEMEEFITTQMDRGDDDHRHGDGNNDVVTVTGQQQRGQICNFGIIKLLLPHVHCYAVSRIVLKLLNAADVCRAECDLSESSNDNNTDSDDICSNETDANRNGELLKCSLNGSFEGFQLVLNFFVNSMSLDDEVSMEAQLNCTKILDQLLEITDNLVQLLINALVLKKVVTSLPLLESVLRKYVLQKDDVTDENIDIIQKNIYDIMNTTPILHDVHYKDLLTVTKIVESLVLMPTEEILNCLMSSNIFNDLIDRFLEYPDFNILHCFVSSIISQIIDSKNLTLLEFLVDEVNLLAKLIDAYDRNKKVEADGGSRLGYMGHIMQISNALSSSDASCLTDNAAFSLFTPNELLPYLTIQNSQYSTKESDGMNTNNAELFTKYHVNDNPLGKLPNDDVIWEDFANFDDIENEFAVDFEDSDENFINSTFESNSDYPEKGNIAIDDIFNASDE